MANCRAKDPNSCRVHGTQTLSLKELETRAKEASDAGDGVAYFEIRAQIEELTRPTITEAAMDDVIATLWVEDGWSGRTKDEFRANIRTSLEAAVTHIRDGSIRSRFASLVYAENMWAEETNGMAWEDAPNNVREALMNQGEEALDVLRPHLK